MKKRMIMMGLLGLVFAWSSASAQVVTKDSMNVLKTQKEVIALGKKINDDKFKLVKLENEIESRKANVSKTAEMAQVSANENGIAADSLSHSALDIKLADKAEKSARNADRDAANARKAVSTLDKLHKEIDELKSRISENEKKQTALSKSSKK